MSRSFLRNEKRGRVNQLKTYYVYPGTPDATSCAASTASAYRRSAVGRRSGKGFNRCSFRESIPWVCSVVVLAGRQREPKSISDVNRVEEEAVQRRFRIEERRPHVLFGGEQVEMIGIVRPVPADGFYEWAKIDPKTKKPYTFSLTNGQPFAFVGLWDVWKNPSNGERLQTFALTPQRTSLRARCMTGRRSCRTQRLRLLAQAWRGWAPPSIYCDLTRLRK